jgi:hypothetical protein
MTGGQRRLAAMFLTVTASEGCEGLSAPRLSAGTPRDPGLAGSPLPTTGKLRHPYI